MCAPPNPRFRTVKGAMSRSKLAQNRMLELPMKRTTFSLIGCVLSASSNARISSSNSPSTRAVTFSTAIPYQSPLAASTHTLTTISKRKKWDLVKFRSVGQVDVQAPFCRPLEMATSLISAGVRRLGQVACLRKSGWSV